jgi:hypothetical protein
VAYSPGVRACSIHNSQIANAAVEIVASEKARLARASRLFHHTGRCTAASVRQTAANMDQMMVTRLMEPARLRAKTLPAVYHAQRCSCTAAAEGAIDRRTPWDTVS